MWRSCNEWSQEKKDEYNKDAERINKAWGEKNESERREKVAKSFESEKDKKASNSKGPKM
ncbi:hypothetical protein [Spiroplasma endosymbiont of Colias croceus]|uniref:hypothetical protein n=1 Tax=Spiroplasma endosymbiont of Colias croceus TaxID=3066310 RepID=UPI0030D27543